MMRCSWPVETGQQTLELRACVTHVCDAAELWPQEQEATAERGAGRSVDMCGGCGRESGRSGGRCGGVCACALERLQLSDANMIRLRAGVKKDQQSTVVLNKKIVIMMWGSNPTQESNICFINHRTRHQQHALKHPTLGHSATHLRQAERALVLDCECRQFFGVQTRSLTETPG